MVLRPEWDDVWMGLARQLAKRSRCHRASVGCVITDFGNRRAHALGYNGGPAGSTRDTCTGEQGSCGCFPANVKVMTAEGPRFIQDIRKGDLVLTHKNRFRTVREVLSRGPADREYVFLKLKGNRFVSTVDHPVLVKKLGGSTGWVRADEIRPGDQVAYLPGKCAHCGDPVPSFRVLCHPCFREQSSARREATSQRMKLNNPTKKVFGERVILDETAAHSSSVKRKQGLADLKDKLLDHAQRLQDETGCRALVVDHIGLRPDIILIDWKNQKVTAYEYEKMRRGVRPEKYQGNTQYDEVIWFVENDRPPKFQTTEEGFPWVQVLSTKRYTQHHSIYNLEVEEDNSYICQGVVVHNCLHAETNALIKLSPSWEPLIAYVTMSPCVLCATALINSGCVKMVVYDQEYRDTSGLDLLREHHVVVRRYDGIKQEVQEDLQEDPAPEGAQVQPEPEEPEVR